MADVQHEQYEEQHRRWYAEWIQKQYDVPSCRAKIVGRTKYEQIIRAVKGELRRAADNSKFRFWVRAKGFRMGRPTSVGAAQVDDANSLYVVDTRNGGGSLVAVSMQPIGALQQHCYKKVAVVDEFFDIIYRVHCGGSISARHSGQKRTHRMIMETYAFLPREAVTAFLMGCPQCSTNNAAPNLQSVVVPVDNAQQPLQPAPQSNAIEQWSPSSFACSTPVKRDSDGEHVRCAATAGNIISINSDKAYEITGEVDKENVTVDVRQTPAVTVKGGGGNKRKRTVPLRRFVRQPCQAIEIASAATVSSNSSSGSSTLKNSSSSTLLLTTSSSQTDYSEMSRSSGGWWLKRGACRNSSRLSASGGAETSDDVAGNMQPLDLSSSPLSAVSPMPTTIRSSSSQSLVVEDFFYKRRRLVRRRRVRSKRLNKSGLSRRVGYHKDDTSASDRDSNDEDRYDSAGNDFSRVVSEKIISGAISSKRVVNRGEQVGVVDMCEEDDGPRPAKMKKIGDRRNNNNDDDYCDKATTAVVAVAVTATTTAAAAATSVSRCVGDSDRIISEDEITTDVMMEAPMTTTADTKKGHAVNDRTEIVESDENQEKSAAMHSPMNKRINGSGHHPYHMHHNPRSIMNGLTASSSPSSLSKTLDTITTSSATHHNFHRHWLDMANDSVNNTNMMDVDGSADDNSMAAAAAAAAAALLFSPPSSVGSGISSGGPLSSLHPNSHLAHHHALSPLAPLALPPHSAASVGLSPAHHHHHQHIQQQLQQYAAAAVAAATAAAAAAAAASSAGDSTSPPPSLPLSLPPMAHHYNQNNNISGSNKRRSTGGTALTVQQQLYRRSGTPTSSTTSSPSPRPLNSKNDADTTTSGTGLHENGSFSSGPPTTSTTVLWPPLGLLTAAHQQHHHSLSSPPKFQQLFGSSVNSLATVTAGSQVLPSLPPPPISSPSSSYRLASKETNGMSVTTTNGNVTGNDIGIGTGTETGMHVDEEDTAIDDDEDEDEEDEEEEDEDLDDDEIEEGEEDADEEEDGDRAADDGDGNGAQARRLRRQQARRLRQLQRTGRNANNITDGVDSGIATSYHQHWQQPSTTTTTANSLSQQQNQQTTGSSSQHIDPERLKAFNMFVRLFVDENLDRQVPISRQPKDKVQAIIDSCGRQFPELSDRSRKRIRTYLKSCRRNKRNTPQAGGAVSSSPPPPTNPWPANSSSSDPTVQPQRPTPAHLTSAQAETILAVACQRESDNARRMRLGLEPVAQPYPYSVASTSASNVFQQPTGTTLLNQNGNSGGTLQMSSTSSDEDTGVGDSSFEKSTSNAIEADTETRNGNDEPDNRDGSDRREGNTSTGGGTGSDSATQSNATSEESSTAITGGVNVTSSSPHNNEIAGPTDLSVNKSSAAPTTGNGIVAAPSSVPLGGGYMSGAGFRSLSSTTSTTTVNHRRISSNNSSSATGMLQLFPSMTTTSSISSGTSTLPLQPSMINQTAPPVQPSSKLLNKADVVTVRQLIAGYRESAAFLLRSADELEHLLLLRG